MKGLTFLMGLVVVTFVAQVEAGDESEVRFDASEIARSLMPDFEAYLRLLSLPDVATRPTDEGQFRKTAQQIWEANILEWKLSSGGNLSGAGAIEWNRPLDDVDIDLGISAGTIAAYETFRRIYCLPFEKRPGVVAELQRAARLNAEDNPYFVKQPINEPTRQP